MTEPGQVYRHQVRVLGEPRPHRLERQQALWPRAQQQGVIVTVLALGEADRQPVDDPELHLDRRVQPGGHPAMVRPGAPRSYPPSDSASGQSLILARRVRSGSARPFEFCPIPLIWTSLRKSSGRTAFPGMTSLTGWAGAPNGRAPAG